MESDHRVRKFQGDSAGFLRQFATFVIILGALLCLTVMGAAWLPMFLVSMLVFAPLLGLLYLFVRRWDRFSLDDSRRSVLLPLRKAIPYEKICGFEVTRSGSLFQTQARTGRFGGARLLLAGDAKDLPYVIRQIQSRFPGLPLKQRVFPIRIVFGAVAAAVLLIHVSLAYYLQRRFPALATPCVEADWLSSVPSTEYGDSYPFEDLLFSLPLGFRLTEGGAASQRYVFEHERRGISVAVRPGMLAGLARGEGEWPARDPQSGRVSRANYFYIMGVTNSFELLHMVYCARFGAIPLLLKAIVLSGGAESPKREIEFFEFEDEQRRGLVKVDSSEGGGKADVLLSGIHTATEIALSVRTRGAVDKSLLGKIIQGVYFPGP